VSIVRRAEARDASRRESEGCPPDFEIPLESPFAKVGTDEEVQQNATRGLVVDSPQDEGCHQVSLIFRQDLGGQRGLNEDDTMTVQQNVAGVWGVPRSLLSSPKSGGSRGLKHE